MRWTPRGPEEAKGRSYPASILRTCEEKRRSENAFVGAFVVHIFDARQPAALKKGTVPGYHLESLRGNVEQRHTCAPRLSRPPTATPILKGEALEGTTVRRPTSDVSSHFKPPAFRAVPDVSSPLQTLKFRVTHNHNHYSSVVEATITISHLQDDQPARGRERSRRPSTLRHCFITAQFSANHPTTSTQEFYRLLTCRMTSPPEEGGGAEMNSRPNTFSLSASLTTGLYPSMSSTLITPPLSPTMRASSAARQPV